MSDADSQLPGDAPGNEAEPRSGARRSRLTPRMPRPLRGLPGRILIFVFGALLITSLAVTSVSLYTMRGFLRDKIERKFPAVLIAANQRLDIWYAQRRSEVDVFASSRVLSESFAAFSDRGASRRDIRAKRDIEQYLSYVIGSFPQYAGIVVLDPDGAVVAGAGAVIELPAETRATAARVPQTSAGDVLPIGDGKRVQLISARVEVRGKLVGSVHALLHLTELAAVLESEELGPDGEVFLIDQSGGVIAGLPDARRNEPRAAALSEKSTALVSEYTTTAGEHVVASTRSLPELGWKLVVEQPYAAAFLPARTALTNVILIDIIIMFGIGLLAFRIAVSIARPIRALAEAAKRVSRGEKDVTIEQVGSTAEVELLIQTFNEMSYQLARDAEQIVASQADAVSANEQLRNQNAELQQLNEVLEQLSITDGLTKLHNHRFFQDQLVRECKRSDRTEHPLTLILFDIDHFKRWNDRLGHAAGDEILAQMALVLNGEIRETDLLARYGGEEFALLACNTDLEGAVALAEKARAKVAATRFLMEPPAPDGEAVTISVGVAQYTGDRKKLFNDADAALYRAKDAGRDCVVACDAEKGLSE